MRNTIFTAACILALGLDALPAAEEKAKAPSARKTALFVQNSGGAELNEKLPAFEDLIASRAAGQALSFISRGDVLNAVKVYPAVQAGPADRNTLGTKADRLLSDNSSAVRLAQNMGADALLIATVNSFGKETKKFNDPSLGVNTVLTVFTLRTSYKLLDGVTGGTLVGESFISAKSVRQTETLQTENTDLLNELFDDAANKMAKSMAGKELPPLEARGANVTLSIAATAKDLQGQEISLPDLRVGDDGKVAGGGTLPMMVSATIEIDGFGSGTTPAQLKVAPGPHKLRLSRVGFEPVELTINAVEGLALSPGMQMSTEGLARWKDIRQFLNRLDTSRKMTDAEAERIRGIATYFKNSHYVFDYRVNTTQAPDIKVTKSIYSVD